MSDRKILAKRLSSIDLLNSPISRNYFELRECAAYYNALKHAEPRRAFHSKLIPACTRFMELTSSREGESVIDSLIRWSAKKRSATGSMSFSATEARKRHPRGYKLLGLRAPLTLEALKAGYRAAVLKHHPDRGGSHENMIIINEAYTEIHELLLEQRYLKADMSLTEAFPSVLKCRDYRYVIGRLLFTMNLDDWAVDEAFRWLELITSAELQQSKYVRDGWQQASLAEPTSKLVARLTAAGMTKQAQATLEIIKAIVFAAESKGFESPKVYLNLPRSI